MIIFYNDILLFSVSAEAGDNISLFIIFIWVCFSVKSVLSKYTEY